jgi:hypothetical protein
MHATRLDLDPFDEAFLADPCAHHGALRDAGPPARRLNNTLHPLASMPVEIVPA